MGEPKLKDTFVSLEELASLTGLKFSYLRRAKEKYGLPYYKFGRLVKVKISEFDRWAEQRRVED
jgi:excisionase family DNA binding protein